MAIQRRIINIILATLAIILVGTAAFLTRLPPLDYTPGEISFGAYENRCLVERINRNRQKEYIVEDSSGNFLFYIPLRNCLLDSRFREGKLRFRDETTKREGYIDSCGYLFFVEETSPDAIMTKPLEAPVATGHAVKKKETTVGFKDTDLEKMRQDHPFRREAAKVLSGKLECTDSLSRRKILNYCEHFRMAYATRDIDFLRQVFSDNALIIVGHTVRQGEKTGHGVSYGEKVRYSVRSKQSYLERLSGIFKSNKTISVEFSDFRILRHPTVEGIYGVSLRQGYKADRYSDEGYLFLLWDFRNASMPMIHVRTWQPHEALLRGDDPIDIGDFNLE